MKTNKIIITLIILCLLLSCQLLAQEPAKKIDKGAWVSVFSQERTLYSKKKIDELIQTCKRENINQIYLQLYQSGRAYYDTSVASRLKYGEILKVAGSDTIDYLLKEAVKNNIAVFAWINMLSLGRNSSADILTKFGVSILTKDQYSHTSLKADGNPEFNKYYVKENQLFLEPADPRVSAYLVSIVRDVIKRYPTLAGVHLDYVRYPYIVPFLPGARFTKYGLSYGYGVKSIEGFRQLEGIDPFSGLDSDENNLKWDNYRRDQITNLVAKVYKTVKDNYPNMSVSCAVLPPERAYLSAFQDWPLWLEKNIVDYVVLMDYALDSRLAYENAKAALSYRNNKNRVFIGLGMFLFKNRQGEFFKQYKDIASLNPDGIVIFSFDDIKSSSF